MDVVCKAHSLEKNQRNRKERKTSPSVHTSEQEKGRRTLSAQQKIKKKIRITKKTVSAVFMREFEKIFCVTSSVVIYQRFFKGPVRSTQHKFSSNVPDVIDVSDKAQWTMFSLLIPCSLPPSSFPFPQPPASFSPVQKKMS